MLNRFGTNFLLLQRLVKLKSELQSLMLHKDFTDWKDKQPSKMKAEAQKIEDYIMGQCGQLWATATEILKVLEPLFSFMKAIEGDKPVMGELYAYASAVCNSSLMNACTKCN